LWKPCGSNSRRGDLPLNNLRRAIQRHWRLTGRNVQTVLNAIADAAACFTTLADKHSLVFRERGGCCPGRAMANGRALERSGGAFQGKVGLRLRVVQCECPCALPHRCCQQRVLSSRRFIQSIVEALHPIRLFGWGLSNRGPISCRMH
jgi:hypothetical protein